MKETGQRRTHNLSRSITRIPRQEQLPHTRIDHSRPRRTLLEPPHCISRALVLIRILPTDVPIPEPFQSEQPGSKLPRTESHVISPKELKADSGGALIFAFAKALGAFTKLWVPSVLEVEEVEVDLASGDTAEG